MWLVEKDNKSAMMTAPVLLACLFDLLMVMIAITLDANYRWGVQFKMQLYLQI